jgi:NAD kinase
MKIGISAQYEDEIKWVRKRIQIIDSSIQCITFDQICTDPENLDNMAFILTIGGDGSVAWLVRTFFELFGDLEQLPPIVPVVRPESVGFLRQLDMSSPKAFENGFKQIQDGKGRKIKRTVLQTEFDGQKYVAVNEIALLCQPHFGEFIIQLDGKTLSQMRGDGLFVLSSLGSTAWGLSYRGAISVDEEALQIVCVGALPGTPNFVVPRSPLSISCKLKNPVIVDSTIQAYQHARLRAYLDKDEKPQETLLTVFDTRLVIDGKICGFGVTRIEIDSSTQIHFLSLSEEMPVTKASKLKDIFNGIKGR